MKELEVIAGAMLEKKAQDVCSMDLRKLGTTICDYFVICHADSGIQVKAIADEVEKQMLVSMKRPVIRSQGKENGFWIIMDYSDVVVHIFQTEYRRFYRLEDLWADAEMHHYTD
ncbi:MAG: ribosome silencing factor [Bacteroidales bacterium]|nr:ribosome silencing factor [Bacteroidales bacterium]